MREKYEFSVYYKNEHTADVIIYPEYEKIEYNMYVDKNDISKLTHVPFMFEHPNIENVFDFLESRCMPKGRSGLAQYLEDLGIDEYNPYEIVRITHGVMWEDNMWLKFPGEQISWEDVRVR